MSPLRGNGSTHPLRRQGNELLRPMPDQWKSTRGSRPVPSPRIGLATDIGGIGGSLPTARAGDPPKKRAANPLCYFWEEHHRSLRNVRLYSRASTTQGEMSCCESCPAQWP